MNFKSHLIAGSIVASGVVAGAINLDRIASDDYLKMVLVWVTTIFFSLFPDFDAASISQRWFFRIVFVALVYLGWKQHFELATLIALLALLPVLDHHRGWTHWKLSPILIAPLTCLLYQFWADGSTSNGSLTLNTAWSSFASYEIYAIACIVGWYTHLVLDGHFKLFPAERNHR